MGEKTGYAVTTYRFRLYRKHMEWFSQTRELYSQVADFYLALILGQELAGLSDYELQRRVELLTQGSKKQGVVPACPMPYGRVPLYFRRAALREAAGAARSYQTRSQTREGTPSRPEHLDTSPVYYQGMYRRLDLEERKIELKLYTPEGWKWAAFRFTMDGRELPAGAQLLSPTIKLEGGQIFLHFPVKIPVCDVRTARERAGEKYLAAVFPHGEVFAACITGQPGEEKGQVRLIRGGKEFYHRRRRLERQLGESLGDRRLEESIREKLRNLIRSQAHRVSRELVDFAGQEGCKLIVVPERFSAESSADQNGAGIESRVAEYSAYKSFQKGIVLCRIPVRGIWESCSICGEAIRESGGQYECVRGHRGNTALNAARNLGRQYRRKYLS